MVFVSLGLRLRVEVEALNMVEALGAYTRHRTVSILRMVKREDGRVGYRMLVAPAVSGQSIAYGYHRAVVELAKLLKLPVCDECLRYETRGGFTKRTTEKLGHDDRVKSCVVEDLTGFLAPDAGVRRTSPVSFSYLVPDVEGAEASLDSQFHVRYNFETNEHTPFTIESGTAVYMLSVAVDVDKIGRLEDGSYVADRAKRVELAFKALAALVEGFTYGAKKARYLPITETVGAIAAVSSPVPFMVTPPRIYRDGRNYLADTIERAQKYQNALQAVNERISVYYMDKEGVASGEPQSSIPVTRATTFTELVEKLLEDLRKNYVR